MFNDLEKLVGALGILLPLPNFREPDVREDFAEPVAVNDALTVAVLLAGIVGVVRARDDFLVGVVA